MMQEAQKRGYGIFCVTLPNLSCEGNDVFGRGDEIEVLGIGKRPFYKLKRSFRLRLAESVAVFLRKDPPFDLAYLHHLYLLSCLRGRVYLQNDPVGVMALSEKVFPLWFEKWIPKTCITRSFQEAESFAQKHKQGVVIKPLNSSGGRGVFQLRGKDSNFQVAFESLSKEGKEYVICQEFLPQVKTGDKRVLLLGGKILGYFIRVPRKGSHRANLHSGGQLKKCKLSAQEMEIAKKVGFSLLQWGIDFAGIDLIGGKLTEINVTSPMGLREINVTQKIRSEKIFMDFVVNKLRMMNASK